MHVIMKTISFLALSTVTSFTPFTSRPIGRKVNFQIESMMGWEESEFVERDHMGAMREISSSEGAQFSVENDPDDLTAEVQAAVEKSKFKEEAISVRFVNFDSRNPLNQVVARVKPGTKLLKVGYELGINVFCKCKTGLCAGCNVDVKNPNWAKGTRDGYQTVRLCQIGAMIPKGCDEMVVDLHRQVEVAPSEEVAAGGSGFVKGTTGGSKNQANFADGWEDDFTPEYKRIGREAVSNEGQRNVRGVKNLFGSGADIHDPSARRVISREKAEKEPDPVPFQAPSSQFSSYNVENNEISKLQGNKAPSQGMKVGMQEENNFSMISPSTMETQEETTRVRSQTENSNTKSERFSAGEKKLRRWVPKSSANIPPWEIIW